jgi:NAD(P)H-dependent flavin oxidoreductase YrpB (nitropropane dioxygenase family)
MEAGQGAGLIKEILPVQDLFNKLIAEFIAAKENICT